MKNIRLVFSKWYVAIPVCILFTVYSCQSSEEVSPVKYEAEVSPISEVTGQDIFKGIFFGTGRVADKVAFFKNNFGDLHKMLSEEEYKMFEAEQNKLIASLETNYPEIFKNFEADMTSGDHLRISDALDNFNAKLVDVIKKENIEALESAGGLVTNLDNIDQDELKAAIQSGDRAKIQEIVGVLQTVDGENNSRVQACSLALACVFTVALVATQAIAITGAVAVALYYTVALVSSVEIGARTGLSNIHQEELINTIAVSLAR